MRVAGCELRDARCGLRVACYGFRGSWCVFRGTRFAVRVTRLVLCDESFYVLETLHVVIENSIIICINCPRDRETVAIDLRYDIMSRTSTRPTTKLIL